MAKTVGTGLEDVIRDWAGDGPIMRTTYRKYRTGGGGFPVFREGERGERLYSYGHHYLLGVRWTINGWDVLAVNKRPSTVTTHQHQYLASKWAKREKLGVYELPDLCPTPEETVTTCKQAIGEYAREIKAMRKSCKQAWKINVLRAHVEAVNGLMDCMDCMGYAARLPVPPEMDAELTFVETEEDFKARETAHALYPETGRDGGGRRKRGKRYGYVWKYLNINGLHAAAPLYRWELVPVRKMRRVPVVELSGDSGWMETLCKL